MQTPEVREGVEQLGKFEQSGKSGIQTIDRICGENKLEK